MAEIPLDGLATNEVLEIASGSKGTRSDGILRNDRGKNLSMRK
mgnify:CR=1 FL=1